MNEAGFLLPQSHQSHHSDSGACSPTNQLSAAMLARRMRDHSSSGCTICSSGRVSLAAMACLAVDHVMIESPFTVRNTGRVVSALRKYTRRGHLFAQRISTASCIVHNATERAYNG